MRRVIVGTAGHVDHGKTRLIEALTGIDCDRWQEEKDRGITIDLGFAHATEGDLQIGFVDVPGHERFLHNALAGMGGIRLVLLVVAADEGVEPQTREHLAICSLLGIPEAVVALTKTDLVEPDLLELGTLELEELLADTPFAGAPVCPVSALTGDGLGTLRATLVERAGRVARVGDDSGPARLPVDRAFHLHGLGVIVTGTLASGQVSVGDELELLPGGSTVRVRSLQVHGASRDVAHAGERTSAQLAGVELEALGRGRQLTTPGALERSHSLLARLELLPDAPKPWTGWTPVRLHLLASEVVAKARPLAPPRLEGGERGIVELRLDAPIVALRGDRLIVRQPSPARTLGGGEVLDSRWHRRRGALRAAAVEDLQGDLDAVLSRWVHEAGEGGTRAADLARRLGHSAAAVSERLDALAARQRVLRVEPRLGQEPVWISPAVVQRVEARARRVLRDYFARERLAESMPKAEAVRRILRGRAAELAEVYLAWLADRKVLTVRSNRVAPPGRQAALSDEESTLATAVAAAFDRAALTPPSPAELCRELGAKPAIFDGVVSYLVRRGKLTRLANGLLLSRSAVDTLARDLRGLGWERFKVPQFKDQFGLSRKWAIPLLEHLDSVGVTRRFGDERQIVG